MKIGVFDHMDRGAVPLVQQYEDRLKLVEAYDRAGFYGYHVAEHHATPLGVASCPGVWLAAVAARTKQLRFGPLVYLLPLYHPIKLIEEICMLDQMSGGRMMFGMGRGISPIEMKFYGMDPEALPAIYSEALDVILKGLTHKVLNYQGRFFNYTNVPMELEPFQQPHPPLWYGLGRAEAVPWAVKNRVNIVANVQDESMRPLTDLYRSEWTRTWGDSAELPLMGVVRHVVIAETEREALAVAKRGYNKWRTSFLKLWKEHNQMPVAHAIFPERFEDAEAQGRAVAGTSDKVASFLQRTVDRAGLNYLLCRFAFGDIAVDESLHSVDLFTRHVMPYLRSM